MVTKVSRRLLHQGKNGSDMPSNGFFPDPEARKPFMALVDQFDALRATGNIDGMEALLSADAVFEYIGSLPYLEFSGTYTGREEIMELHRRAHREVEILESEVVDCLAEGDRLFTRRRALIRHRGTSRRDWCETWGTWEFRGKQIAASRKFLDLSVWDRLRKD